MMKAPNFRVVIFRPPIADAHAQDFGEIYQFWKQSWSQVYRDIGGSFHEESDNLSRQHEIIVLFGDEAPLAMVCHRFVNFKDPGCYHDSYFKTGWSTESLFALKTKASGFSGLGAIGSQIFVSPEWRGKIAGVSLKYLVSFLSFELIRRHKIAFTIGTIRVDRGMDQVFGLCGAIPLAQGLDYFGAKIDLVYFAPSEKPISIPPDAQQAVNELLASATNVESNFSFNTNRRSA